MSVSIFLYVLSERTRLPGLSEVSGFPGAIPTTGAHRAFPSSRAIFSPLNRTTLLCWLTVTYGPLSSIPPTSTSAVVLPAFSESRISSSVMSSIHTVSCMAMGLDMVFMSTRCRSGCCATATPAASTKAAHIRFFIQAPLVECTGNGLDGFENLAFPGNPRQGVDVFVDGPVFLQLGDVLADDFVGCLRCRSRPNRRAK